MDKIFGMDFEINLADIVAIGIPIGKNSEKVLNFLRKASLFFETFDIEKKRGINLKIFDEGNLKFKDRFEITKKIKEILEKNKIPLIFSKSHLVSLFSIQAFEKDLKIIVFDAHADCKNNYIDEKIEESIEPLKLNKNIYNCSTWLRRLIESGYKNIMLIGLRACSDEEIEFLEKSKIQYITSNFIKKNLKDARKKIKNFVGNSKVYLSLDMDFFDPSISPAVDHPEANGLSYEEFKSLIENIELKIFALDIVEIAFTEKKLMEMTFSLAFKVLFDLLLKMENNF